MTEEWRDVGAAGEIEDDMPLSAKAGEHEIGVYRFNGQYYVLEDVCPHAYALLSQGFVMDGQIECPLHGARWEIPTGKLTAEPGGRDLRCFECKVEDGRVLVKVPSP